MRLYIERFIMLGLSEDKMRCKKCLEEVKPNRSLPNRSLYQKILGLLFSTLFILLSIILLPFLLILVLYYKIDIPN